MKAKLKKISCISCGAELVFNPGTQMINCNFCGSKFEIEKTTDEEVSVSDGIIPFKVTKKEYHQAILQWLSEGDYTPDDILTSSVFDKINGLYLPMYFYKGKYHGNWSASSGYDRRVEYTEWNESQKKMVRKTKTVTDWRPSSGQVAGEFSVLGFAGSGQGIKPQIAHCAWRTTLNHGDLKNYDSRYTLGFSLLEFTTGEEDVWNTLGEPRANAIAKAKIRVPGNRHKDLSSNILCDREAAIKVYVPYWIVYYKYMEKEFYVCMDGTTVSRIDGERPEDANRKKAVSGFFLLSHIILGVWLLLSFILLADEAKETSSIPKVGPVVVVIGLVIVIVSYIVSGVRRNALIEKSKLARQNILKSIQSDEKQKHQ